MVSDDSTSRVMALTTERVSNIRWLDGEKLFTVESGLFLDVVVGEGAAILKLLAGEGLDD